MKNQNHSNKLNQLGFSLVEVLVVGAIMSILVLGISTVMVNSTRQAQSVSTKSDFNSLVNSVQGILNNTGNCLAAFGGSGKTVVAGTPSDASPVPVKIDLGGITIETGGKYDTLKIDKLQITGKTASGGVNQWHMPLQLIVDRSNGNEPTVGGKMLAHTFDLIVTLDASNAIVGCSGTFSDYWVKSGANPNNIVYTGGSVGIGLEDPKAELDVNGTAQAKVFMYSSDARLKENVREIPGALERVLKLHGVKYDWKNRAERPNGTDQLGFIAQEVEAIFPEAVATHPETGLKSVAYGNLVAPLIEALKEQQKIIRKQQEEIAEIKKELSKR